MNSFTWKRRLAWGLITVWTLLVAASLLWNRHQARQTALELARTKTHLSYKKDLAYRLWAASHGGVYVPITPQTPPNPYLSHVPERDIKTPSGRALTLMNPAYMTRQVHELAAGIYGIQARLTSLNPIRPENAPDAWEARALKAFEAGAPEVSEVVQKAGEPYLRVMHPFLTEKACLKCHATQGYKEGDIRGGICVDVPLAPFLAPVRSQTFTLAASHVLIWLLGLVGIVVGNRRLWHYLDERTQAEEALRESEGRFRKVFEHAATGIAITDWEGRFLKCNPAYCALLGYSEEELRQIKFAALIHPGDQSVNLEEIRRLQTGKVPFFEVENRYLHKDGHPVWVHKFVQVLPGASGRPAQIMALVTDVTERKRAEKALKEAHDGLEQKVAERTAERLALAQRYEYLTKYANDIILIMDQDWKIIEANDRALAAYGYTEEELLHLHIGDLRSQGDHSTPDKSLWEKEGHDNLTFETEHRRKDGTTFPVAISSSMLKIGEVKFHQQIIRDMTEIKRKEKVLQESAQQLRFLTSQLIMIQENERWRISKELHDELGQSLMVLKFQIESIEAGLAKGKEEAMADFQFLIHYMDGVIEKVRRLSRDLSPASLEELGLAVAVKNLFEEFNGHLEIYWSPEEVDELSHLFSPLVELNIYRIFQESLTNIGRYAQASQISVSIEKQEEKVIFSVEDNGIGFEVDEVRRRENRGRGIGLAAMEERARLVGGSLEVWSHPGMGTKITFIIPLG